MGKIKIGRKEKTIQECDKWFNGEGEFETKRIRKEKRKEE